MREIEKFPTAKLCAIGKVGVFGEGVVLPAAGVGDGRAAPDTGRAVEIEEGAAAGARAVLDDEMAVEENGFNFREQRVVAVDIGPTRLDHRSL